MNNFYKRVGEIHRYVVKAAATNKETLIVEIPGKIKALRAAGLPIDLSRANPGQAVWGKKISIEEARKVLAEPDENLALIN